jgi:hypothetical protein
MFQDNFLTAKYNNDQNFVVQDGRFLEAPMQKLVCRRSESKFVSTLLQETLSPFYFSFKRFQA